MTPPLSDESTRAGLARAIWHNAATLIFDELAAHRGVVVPGLGTFTVDVREN